MEPHGAGRGGAERSSTEVSEAKKVGGGLLKPRGVVALSLLSILVAIGAAAAMLLYLTTPDFCSVGTLRHGANIKHAAELVLVVGLAELVMIIFARHRQVLLSYVLFFAAATLGAAVLLVALDSATYVARLSGYFLGPCSGTWARHVGYLYFLWGVPSSSFCCKPAAL
jgi:hypothetical protein